MISKQRKNKKVNMSTIAELAQTSVMTVSRVLNNKPDVSSETRERVLALIKEQGYKPHALARKLSGGKTRIIGVALYSKGTPVNGLYVEVLQGLQSGLADNHYDLLLLAPSKTDRYNERLEQNMVLDGLVLMGNWTSENDIIQLRDSGFPYITIGRRCAGDYTAPFVAPDYEKTFCEIVDFAISNDAHKISILISGVDDEGQLYTPPVHDRLAGIEKVRTFHQLPPESIQLIATSSGQFADGYNKFMNMPALPDAVILDSTEFSFGAAMAMRDRNIRVHEDIQLFGVDYQNNVTRRCEDLLGVSIPRWKVPWLDIGRRAAQHIVQFVDSDEIEDINEYVNFERSNLYVL